jgi:hypothetical protein
MRRVIRTKDPDRPSTRLSTMAASDLTTISRRRQAEAPKLIREVRGDLDWIVMKAMEKDRNRRYPTANGLAVEVGRFLNEEPVLARPPSALYRMKKSFQRNKLLFTSGALIFVLLVVSLAVTSLLLARERKAHHLLDVLQLETLANDRLRENKPFEAEAALRQSVLLRHRYLQGAPPAPQALNALVQYFALRNQTELAENLFDLILTPSVLADPTNGDLRALRVDIRARGGKWEAAANEAAVLVNLEPDNSYRCHMLAPLLVATTNLDAYRRLCSNMVVHFGSTTNPFIADPMAKDCLILPSSGVDLKQVAAMANLAVSEGKNLAAYHFFECCDALAEYRLGHFGDAIKWAQESAKNEFPLSQAEAYAVMAMAQCKLGDVHAAQGSLARCNEIITKRLPRLGKDLGGDWRDWIIAHALQTEAKGLIESSPFPAGVSGAK